MARDYYVILGGTTHDDMNVRYQIAHDYRYLNAGGGEWYSKPLCNLQPGDHVFAYVGGKGYVGIGRVMDEAIFAREATVGGGGLLVNQPDIDANFVERAHRRDDTTELVVRVKWAKIVSVDQAVFETGLFSHQRTVCELKTNNPTHRRTVETVEAAFGVSRDTKS